MKKRISIFLCAVFCILTLAGCGAAKEEPDYTAMRATVDRVLELCGSADQGYVDALKDIREEELDHALVESGIPASAATFVDILQSWITAQDEMGAMQSCSDFTFTEENGQINATAQAQYETRGADIVISFKEDGTLKGLSVGAYYSTSEILYKAAMNTLIGMGSVFGVLIFIAIIIAIMGKIMTSAEKSGKPAEPAKKAEAPAAAPVVDETDDLELVAVISAAIAASTGASTDSFVVRSIKRRSRNTGWNRA